MKQCLKRNSTLMARLGRYNPHAKLYLGDPSPSLISLHCVSQGTKKMQKRRDFHKAFDIVPKSKFWRRLIEVTMPLQYRVVVPHLYELVKCQCKMDSGFSKYFLSNMGLKDGCPLTPTHFNICIDKHDKIVNKVAKEE